MAFGLVVAQSKLCVQMLAAMNWTIVSSGNRLSKSSASACARAVSPANARARAAAARTSRPVGKLKCRRDPLPGLGWIAEESFPQGCCGFDS